jgi:hypothetical protein
MMPSTDFALWHQLHNLEIQHWYDVNINGGGSVHELYIDDGVLTVGNTQHRGRRAIREFYEARAKRGVRTARHLLSNFRIVAGVDERRAHAAGIISLYAADGEPLLDSKPAVLMADLINDYVCSDEGTWRYVSHVLRPIFVGNDAFVRNLIV